MHVSQCFPNWSSGKRDQQSRTSVTNTCNRCVWSLEKAKLYPRTGLTNTGIVIDISYSSLWDLQGDLLSTCLCVNIRVVGFAGRALVLVHWFAEQSFVLQNSWGSRRRLHAICLCAGLQTTICFI